MDDQDFGDDLRAALRPDDGIRPLDPAQVIAGARRRHRVRGLAAAGLASVAVLAVAAGGLLASGSPTGTAPAPAGPPTAGTSVPLTPDRPTPLRNATPSAAVPSGKKLDPTDTPNTPDPTDTPNTPPPASTPFGMLSSPSDHATSKLDDPAAAAAFANRCRTAVREQSPGPGGSAVLKAALTGPEGTLVILAGGNYWAACDSGFGPDEVTVRAAASTQPPKRDDVKAFTVANNLLTLNAQQYEYYWAAGVLPQGVAGVRYTFPDGAVTNATVAGDFWLMQHRSSTPGGHQPTTPRIKVELLAQDDKVLVVHELEWSLHTCAQVSHGC